MKICFEIVTFCFMVESNDSRWPQYYPIINLIPGNILILLIYNGFQILFLLVIAPILLLLVLLKKNYRNRLLRRLGFGLSTQLRQRPAQKTNTIWLHALSVGEITSAVPLIRGLREQFPNTFLVVSTATRSGGQLADKLLEKDVDCLIGSPFDLLPIVLFWVKTIRPDLFILVETDFWPNWLFALRRNRTSSLLVNGRISRKSMQAYSRSPRLFQPLFNSFTALCMQTAIDKSMMINLGINSNKVHTLGNLKYDTPVRDSLPDGPAGRLAPKNSLLWVCGSTHRGEEEILLTTYRGLRELYPRLFCIMVPRKIERAEEIRQLGKGLGLSSACWSKETPTDHDFVILDTIGQLTSLYHQAQLAFVGGSLVQEGGHNPIEAALAGIPVLFGPHMDDFAEIAENLVRGGGAFQVNTVEELSNCVSQLLQSEEKRRAIGQKGLATIKQQQGVITAHLNLIRQLLPNDP